MSSAPVGLIVLDKPAGITSHGAVAAVRRALDTRRVGHAGTLDPMATGVLILGVGHGTRLLGHLALTDKSYAATIRLGSATVTDDREGEVTATADPAALAALTRDQVISAMAALTGDIDQVPSAVSAIKVAGRRAHALVRSGASVELKARRVRVDRFELVDLRLDEAVELDVLVDCSTGTYVRALARDLGAALGVGGHLTALRRTRVGPWSIAEAVTLDGLSDADLIDLASAAARSFPVARLSAAEVADVRHGRRIAWPADGQGVIALLGGDGAVIALAEEHGAQARTLVVFPE